MADLANPTGNVTLWDENGNPIAVTLNAVSGIYELRVKDLDVLNALTSGGSAVKTEWQYYTENGKGFQVTSTFLTLSGSSETDFMLFRNPTGSGINIEIKRFFYTYTKGSAIALMKLYRGPTITNVGSARTVEKMKLGGAISPAALVYTQPTISNRGTLLRAIGNSSVQTLQLDYDLALFIPPATDILITIQPASNNTDHSVGMEWAEE
jgi:hypothetical protein